MTSRSTHAAIGVAAVLLAASPRLEAQSPLTLDAAIARAVAEYPAIDAAAARVDAADAAVALARTAYLPRADALWQVNRATHNNIAGLLFPNPVIAPISGPVTTSEQFGGVWGTAAGVLVTWEPFDFGVRSANVRIAEASRHAADADRAVTTLQVSAAAADAFLAVIAADESVRAAHAGVERARVLFDLVDARARAGLRPGAEAARARAEVAAAQSAEARAEEAAAVARAELARWIRLPPDALDLQSAPFLQLPAAPPSLGGEYHPLLEARRARADAARFAEEAAARAYAPRVLVEGTTYARGSAIADETPASSGFAFDRRNWAVGLNVTFPLLDLPALKERRAVERAHEREAEALHEQALADLDADVLKARAAIEAARRLASLAPAQLEAARAAAEQARARYDAGLGTIADVADTERLVTDADAANALAVLGVWRAQLAYAAARGDLNRFFK